MKKKEKSTGAVFIMAIETSKLYFIYLFILPKFSIYFTKIVFKGTATINREKHILKTRNQDNTEIDNDFSMEFWNSNSFHIENTKL